MANKTVTKIVQTTSGGKVHYQVVMLADKDGNLLNSFGASANIPIAAGSVEGYSHINKFELIIKNGLDQFPLPVFLTPPDLALLDLFLKFCLTPFLFGVCLSIRFPKNLLPIFLVFKLVFQKLCH